MTILSDNVMHSDSESLLVLFCCPVGSKLLTCVVDYAGKILQRLCPSLKYQGMELNVVIFFPEYMYYSLS